MRTMILKPSDIYYSQDSVSRYFDRKSSHSSQTIGQTLDEIIIGRCSVRNIPKISVLKLPGNGDKWFSVDNRRLWVFKQLERLRYCDTIEVVLTFFNSRLHGRKITTLNGGSSIRIRGGGEPGGKCHTLPDSCFPQIQKMLQEDQERQTRRADCKRSTGITPSERKSTEDIHKNIAKQGHVRSVRDHGSYGAEADSVPIAERDTLEHSFTKCCSNQGVDTSLKIPSNKSKTPNFGEMSYKRSTFDDLSSSEIQRPSKHTLLKETRNEHLSTYDTNAPGRCSESETLDGRPVSQRKNKLLKENTDLYTNHNTNNTRPAMSRFGTRIAEYNVDRSVPLTKRYTTSLNKTQTDKECDNNVQLKCSSDEVQNKQEKYGNNVTTPRHVEFPSSRIACVTTVKSPSQHIVDDEVDFRNEFQRRHTAEKPPKKDHKHRQQHTTYKENVPIAWGETSKENNFDVNHVPGVKHLNYPRTPTRNSSAKNVARAADHVGKVRLQSKYITTGATPSGLSRRYETRVPTYKPDDEHPSVDQMQSALFVHTFHKEQHEKGTKYSSLGRSWSTETIYGSGEESS